MTSPLSGRQSGKLHAVLGELGVTDRAEKLRVVGACVYRDLTSTNDLTWHEASVCINTLTSIAAVRDDRQGALDRLVEVAQRRGAVA